MKKGLNRKLRKLVLIRRLEKIGVRPKANGIPGKYLIGYKLASRIKRELREFFKKVGQTPKEGVEYYKENFVIDWENPYTIKW